jgi:hypothetical protein
MFADSSGHDIHPVAYIEHGGHEFWRGPGGSNPFSHNHNGEGHQLLVRNVPNAGEVEHPMQGWSAVLRFSGLWGWRNGFSATSPPGPALHKEWHWPSDSKVYSKVSGCLEP